MVLALRSCGRLAAIGVGLVLSTCLLHPDTVGAFTVFESGPVRPLAMAPDGSRLFAVNTPDNQLEAFAINEDGSLTYVGSVPVGLEPVAVAARSADEVWVVNHLSDSVSVVRFDSLPGRVVRTLLVGDEPRDIVFAGPGRARAFITTAHRGQNVPYDPQFTTPGVGRADVWVFDAENLGNGLGGTPLTIVQLFGDTPRALAASPDGSRVYAAVFHSGNQTTAIAEPLVCNGGASAGPCVVSGVTMPGGLPPPNENFEHKPGPEVGLIVKYDRATGRWLDSAGRDWTGAVRFNLPDYDVFTIDATADPPQEITNGRYSGVGTVLFNMAVNPANGRVYVTNTEARNEVRFEGPGIFGGSTVRGRLHQARITVLDGPNVMPRHLNKHIDYDVVPAPAVVNRASLATPLDLVVSSDGTTLYVAAFGSSKIGIFSTQELEADTFVPSSNTHIEVGGGGPAGILLNEAANRLYVLTRFDNAVAVIDLAKRREVQRIWLNNPEPFSVLAGRRFLYDARLTSSNGEASCASCHVFADVDSLAWELGNPDDVVQPNPNPFRIGPVGDASFHPLKGPMTTQTLRGLANHGPMHWRGDRTGGHLPGGSALDAVAAFKAFNVAFQGLLGRKQQLADADMQRFADFILQVIPPPNPVRNLDNSLTPDQQAGRNFYFNTNVDAGVLKCNTCHVLNPSQGFFGTDGLSSFEGETQHFKIPHLRNAYTKIGMFGSLPNPQLPGGPALHQGDQIRGFGFLHDGTVDTLFRFFTATVFTFPDDATRRQVEQFVLAFDSNLAPIVGQQITLTASNEAVVSPRITLLESRSAVGECDLVVKARVNGEMRGWYRTASGNFQSDRAGEPPWSEAALRILAQTPGQEVTYTCVPPGEGVRIAVDRDEDGVFDGDERDAGTDPASALSLPNAAIVCASTLSLSAPKLRITKNGPPTGDEGFRLSADVIVGSQGEAVDPQAFGVQIRVDDRLGNPLFNRVVPRGETARSDYPGWVTNTRRTRWVYRDKSGQRSLGIRRVVVEDRSKTMPGVFRISVTGARGPFSVDPTQLPLRLTVVLGGRAQAAQGLCGTIDFDAPIGSSPSCRVNSSGTTVSCR
ncbi:MAG: hypothetical protein KatS3mg077_0350 [Candidatus Binatia bacterium]|nr:MAG: hypothetical protein KatS3mg077_0350 [Candidatus Binatia bacterium]